jgi:hypothetical protein
MINLWIEEQTFKEEAHYTPNTLRYLIGIPIVHVVRDVTFSLFLFGGKGAFLCHRRTGNPHNDCHDCRPSRRNAFLAS